jgi:hypothetical protein
MVFRIAMLKAAIAELALQRFLSSELASPAALNR